MNEKGECPSSILEKLKVYQNRMEEELRHTMDFWINHSHDSQNGGFFTCLGQDGKIYDTDKYGWMLGRQVWMYSKLYNETAEYKTDFVLKAALSGAEFLMKHVSRQEDGRCYFQVTADGKPIKLQRKLFTECFYAMAMAELGRAMDMQKYKIQAEETLSKIIYWARVDDSALGLTKLEGQMLVNAMAIPMMLLCVIDEVCGCDEAIRERYAADEEWAVQQILQHVQRDGSIILETVSMDGKELPGIHGRHMNPGHAMEAGWFLLQYAARKGNKELQQTAIDKFIKAPFDLGWDKKHEGIFYFLDADGLCPVPLEWNMKLWWVHNEALIALLMAYEKTREEGLLQRFDQCFNYAFNKFPDPKHGEWFGYLDRRGDITHTIKGGPFKGCFHLPRCLYVCIDMLHMILQS
ncbi:N-acylglucosamine 2-epimerase-like [Actinia tenebrosa]|uniref:N-acylglucosamine 2-epimerase n=1 Tax=Actinia tenebrosa TaxID=6105 RepID=A0A6P8H9V0_ACTTE|nr:N-acylglucosamine 2-epimerase-like [Actinia tenebrosa]